MIKYFISFVFTSKNGPGVGNREVDREKSVADLNDIRSLEEEIKEKCGYDGVTISSFQRFEDTPE